jgi:hypothetical protein
MVNMESGRIAVPPAPNRNRFSSVDNPFVEQISVVTSALPSE